ncbi:secondary thiamine-phosphate synthase enzyme YjbQ [Candidatus Uabimicrobium sp. HlEnr_7]|uniref:secondary thiamine-phosphate synthase enzyme YjbQ n=1 Tax=Candidatus Uabimicrobium helgolandensis TaxID=3095367 RepID=UPI003557E9F7
MKHYSKKVTVKSEQPRDYFAITQQVSFVVAESEIKNGIVLCYSGSNTSSIFIHIEDKNLLQDIDQCLHKFAPEKPYSQYAFNVNRNDAAAHIKSVFLGRQVSVSVNEGVLELDEDDHIIFADFDGGREKTILVKIIGV